MWNNTNPAELYTGTTWELITSGKYIQTGNTALTIGGSNSVNIGKVNLPAIKLKVDSFSLNVDHAHEIYGSNALHGDAVGIRNSGWRVGVGGPVQGEGANAYTLTNAKGNQIIKNTVASTGSASPSTETLGNGTPLNIQPAYITLKFWKRLT